MTRYREHYTPTTTRPTTGELALRLLLIFCIAAALTIAALGYFDLITK